ncbi:hypothetical protein KBP30_39700 [Streptomyces sp. Go40/10]|uniref:hypothetical protein n=1 Tax=Streptomyces sp. Go40/10 TaxID=2825844 RepID=UPI001E60866C|nr:hypothetical protein [Streptomyces sp. Go40/10]UFR06924.1 hypothetical protein KBP30_39700 [Streptomyces sp. Go40/10]
MAEGHRERQRGADTGPRCSAIRGVVAVLALLAMVSGCTTLRTERSDQPHRDLTVRRPAVLQAAGALLVTDTAGRRQRWELFQAEELLDRRCMHRKGYRYLVTRLGHEPVAGAVTEDVTGSGPATYDVEALMPRTGDGTPRTRTAGGQPFVPPEDRYVRQLSKAARQRYLAALNGDPRDAGSLTLPSGARGTYTRGGCVGEVRARIYGSVRKALQDKLVPQDVTRMFHDFLASDRSYKSALGMWHQCMVRHGFQVQQPSDAIASVQALAARAPDAKTLDARQHAVAAADRLCDSASHVRMLSDRARVAFVSRLPGSVQSLLQQVYASRKHALAFVRRSDVT